VFPAITFAICVICLFFYRIDKKLEIEITDELTERRRLYAPPAAAPVPVPAP
jgi:Na+/melibiose symporter-like transporter